MKWIHSNDYKTCGDEKDEIVSISSEKLFSHGNFQLHRIFRKQYRISSEILMNSVKMTSNIGQYFVYIETRFE